MAQQKTLTERQVGILRWIADGCRDGVMDGDSHRISAAALRGRGLLRTSGRGPTWTPEVTDSGLEYLARVDGRDRLTPRQANVSVTQQLVDDVTAAGGTLRVPRKAWYDREGVDYENRVRLAERHRKVPEGKHGCMAIRCVDEPDLELVVERGDDEAPRARFSPSRGHLSEPETPRVALPGARGR